MPISDKDLGKYNRPGIFIEEIDASVIELPVQDVLINLVPGFSKKGPVNRPVYISNKTDFIKIFGEIDKSLERKGSYFHRTCLKMIESGPIWALNLLSTDDTRDKLNWKTISLASYYDNEVIKEMPYSRVFNRQDFWQRDDESFLDYVNDPTPENDKLLHITNMGDKTITTFMFKSSVEGFDVSAEEWYGGATKVPAFVHPKDWVSDYLVTVVVLEGDWTDYDRLSVDNVWADYFDLTGLLKGNIEDFLNEKNVNVLAYYDGSLIPYFKDVTGKNMYIKSLINNNTDVSGLFCTINEDVLLDADYPTGRLDVIGSSIVNTEKSEIDFLSYNETIIESLTYEQQDLNDNGNVFGNYSTVLTDEFVGGTDRKGNLTNGYVHDYSISTTGSSLLGVYAVVLDDGSALTGGTGTEYWLDVALLDNEWIPTPDYGPHDQLGVGDIVYFNIDFDGGTIEAGTPYYVVGESQDGHMIQISKTENGLPLEFSQEYQPIDSAILYVQKLEMNVQFNTANAYFNIDGASYTFDTGVTTITFDPLDIESSVLGTVTDAQRIDLLYLSKGNDATVNILKGQQDESVDTPPAFNLSPEDYILLGYVKFATVDQGTGTGSTNVYVTMDYTPVSLDTNGYVPLTNIICSGVTIGTTNYLQMNFVGSSGITDNTDYAKIRMRQAYNEIEDGLNDYRGVIIDTTGAKFPVTTLTSYDYSTINDGIIRINVGSNNPADYYNSGDTSQFLLHYIDNEFVMADSGADRLFTSLLPVSQLVGSGQTGNAGVIGKYSQIYLDYYNGIINNWDTIFQFNDTGSTTQIFLKMWLEDTDLYVDFVSDTTGVSPEGITEWDTSYMYQLIVWSNNSNYKQTVEIESFDTTKYPNNVHEIKIDKTRFSEIIKGSFLEGYYESATGGTRKLVRVISTTQDPDDASLKIVKTDGPIAITGFSKVGSVGIDYSTMAYPQIDVYVSTYKGVALAPFKIHADSIPNKTEARQSEILEIVSKTTNLAKALANKNKISWRYLVDSFGLGLTDKSKQQLVDLCGLKLNCLGFLNMPSAKMLKKSDNPSFTNDDGTLNIELLKLGGDETKSPSFLYSFGEGIGATCAGYFFPYVQVDDDGIPLSFPPASYAASTYMRKFLTSQAGIEPWTISAGITNGRISDIGDTEMDFTDEDLSYLYRMGANAIVKKKDAGFCIDNESTAKIFPFSSLSLMHSREVLIELENALYNMLLKYQWKFNTPEVRSEIKFRADKICKDLQSRSALYNFLNIIDERNNTNYIIDLQMGVLDTYIEIVKGMGIIVNNITILKKGDIDSGGFL